MPTPAIFTTLGTLAQPSGLERLQQQLSEAARPIDDTRREALRALVSSELARHPQLSKTRIRIGETGAPGVYFPKADLVSVEEASPALIGHELGHAVSMQSASPAYKKIQDLSREITRIQKYTAIPTALVISALLKGSPAAKAFNILSLVSAGTALPMLVEEAGASADALQSVPDKMQAVKELLPGFARYVALASLPPIAYQLAKHLVARG